jgi:hypothetical protein
MTRVITGVANWARCTIVSRGAIARGVHPIYVSYQPMDGPNSAIMKIAVNVCWAALSRAALSRAALSRAALSRAALNRAALSRAALSRTVFGKATLSRAWSARP